MAGDWDGPGLVQLLDRLETAGRDPDPRLELDPETLAQAWTAASAEVAASTALHEHIASSSRLSVAGARAALETVLGATTDPGLIELLHAGWSMPRVASPLLVVLPGNVPGLAAQSLLPAIARGRPVLFKSSRDEPWSTPALLRALTERVPALAPSAAAVCWPGGDETLEATVANRVGSTLVYGSDGALASWRARDPAAFELGPRGSISIVDLDQVDDLDTLAEALARDTALLDQRGCLSLTGILSLGQLTRARAFAHALVAALAARARVWPPGPSLPAELARVRSWRLAAAASGAELFLLDEPREGGVIVDPGGDLLASPGLRHLTVVPLANPSDIDHLLHPFAGRLQGVALAAGRTEGLEPQLARLGATHVCNPGELQQPHARWANGGLDPLELVARGRS